MILKKIYKNMSNYFIGKRYNKWNVPNRTGR